jgi:hypothetical protein
MPRTPFPPSRTWLLLAPLALTPACQGPEPTDVPTPEQASADERQHVSDDVVGVTLSIPAAWTVDREQYTLGGTYGFTLWKPGADGDTGPHARRPALRVALAYESRTEEVETRAQARAAQWPELALQPRSVLVGDAGLSGVAVGPIPGSTPSFEVYLPVEDRVYLLHVYAESLGMEEHALLSGLKFHAPTRTVASLGLLDGNSPEALELPEPAHAARERAQRVMAAALREGTVSEQAEEVQIEEGCWRAASAFYVQTQHGMYANQRWGTGYVGWTVIGRPNFWGQYTHGNLGYGRCSATNYTNDKYAIDYPLAVGDVLFSPFKSGTVTFAGRNTTHADYGILVTIRAGNGKYVSLSGHLSGLASGIRAGATVTDATIIGYAGATGGGTIPVGEPHLHQAFYRYPRYNPDGAPYGGAGLQVLHHNYVGTAAGTGPGVYRFGWTSSSTVWSQGDWISN